jgi:hypothetical protein
MTIPRSELTYEARRIADDPDRKCRGVLTYLNGLAEDEEWHCDLLEGHEGVCCAPDGTSW